MDTTSVTTKGQVTIPKAVRDALGITPGSRVRFALVGDHAELRPARRNAAAPPSGFGLLKSKKRSVPASFDAATLLRPSRSAGRTR
jgi:AbrB family looped-hinge helix DNA binding protein